MQRWRYHSLLMRDLSIADSKLNVEGEKGWELVSICLIDANTARAFFKQPTDGLPAEAAVAADAPRTETAPVERSTERPAPTDILNIVR